MWRSHGRPMLIDPLVILFFVGVIALAWLVAKLPWYFLGWR